MIHLAISLATCVAAKLRDKLRDKLHSVTAPLVRVEIIHKSKFLPGTVEKNSSTIRSSGRNAGAGCSDH